MRWLMQGMFGMMLACSQPDGGALYRQAAGQPPAEAAETCEAIPDESLQGECLSFTASAAAKAGDMALAASICARASAQLWREECAFLVADRAGRLRAGAAEDCAAAGRFEGDCLSHALERDLKKLPRAARGPGGEAELHAELLDMATHYSSDDPAHNAEMLLAHIIARRVGPGPLRMQACGVAPAAACHKGFLIALSSAGPRVNRTAACQEPRTAESLAAAGLRPWTDDAEEPAREAVAAWCAVVAAGGDPAHLGDVLDAPPTLPMGTYYLLPPPWLPGVTQVPWDDGI